MERDMARTGTRFHHCVTTLLVMQRFILCVNSVNEDSIDAEVGCKCEAIRGVGNYAMRMRRFLALSTGSGQFRPLRS